MDDEEDWVGEPPEGRYTRERAKPEFWRSQRPPIIMGVGLVVVVAFLIVVFVLR